MWTEWSKWIPKAGLTIPNIKPSWLVTASSAPRVTTFLAQTNVRLRPTISVENAVGMGSSAFGY